MNVYHVHTWCLWRSEEGVHSPGTGAADGCKHYVVLVTEAGAPGRAASVISRHAVSPWPLGYLALLYVNVVLEKKKKQNTFSSASHGCLLALYIIGPFKWPHKVS